MRETLESIRVLGLWRWLFLGYAYRPLSRLMHRFHLHYAPVHEMDDGRRIAWCQWCGLRYDMNASIAREFDEHAAAAVPYETEVELVKRIFELEAALRETLGIVSHPKGSTPHYACKACDVIQAARAVLVSGAGNEAVTGPASASVEGTADKPGDRAAAANPAPSADYRAEMSLPRSEYPRCPVCGGPVAGAMMTSQSVDLGFGAAPRMTYYHPDAISVYCVNASCNWDHKLAELTTPVPPERGQKGAGE